VSRLACRINGLPFGEVEEERLRIWSEEYRKQKEQNEAGNLLTLRQ